MKIQKLDSRIFPFIKNIRIAVLILGTAILFFACKNNEIDKIQAFTSPENLPVLEANNLEIVQTDSGQVMYSMKTPKMLRFEIDRKFTHEFPEGIEIVEYDNKKNIKSSLIADYAKEYIKEQKWEAKNNVIVTNIKGDTLKTEHLILDKKTEEIYTEEFVKIISESKEITGLGLTSDQNMENWKIKNVKGIIYVDVNNKQQTSQAPKENSSAPEPDKEKPQKAQAVKFK